MAYKTHYHITMSSGTNLDISGDSAGQAILKALNWRRGETVSACYCGNADMGVMDAGRVVFEVPPHKPLPVVPIPGEQHLCAGYLSIGDSVKIEDSYGEERWHLIDSIVDSPSTIKISTKEGVETRLNKNTLVEAKVVEK